MIQTLEDTTKRNVVSPVKGSGEGWAVGRGRGRGGEYPTLPLPAHPPAAAPPTPPTPAPAWQNLRKNLEAFLVCHVLSLRAPLQVRTIVTETSFTIDELEELYALFKVSFKVNSEG